MVSLQILRIPTSNVFVVQWFRRPTESQMIVGSIPAHGKNIFFFLLMFLDSPFLTFTSMSNRTGIHGKNKRFFFFCFANTLMNERERLEREIRE